jgi:large subunit ribosomal protein L6e
MADKDVKKAKAKPKPTPKPAAAGDGATKKKKRWGHVRNVKLPNGVMRFSQNRMYKKHMLWKKMKKSEPKKEKTPRKKKVVFIKKDIGGDKNGGHRMVRVKKLPQYYTVHPSPPKRDIRRACFSRHTHRLRKSLTPGTVCIVLAGRHKGKHVVFLKQLTRTGLLMVTGPHKLNGVPIRRINQVFVIATKTKIDVSGVKLPAHIKDTYFKRQKPKKTKKRKAEGDIFETKKKASYELTEQRKKDQIEVDKQVLAAITKRPDKKAMMGYLKSYFRLNNGTYPHRMVF